MNSELDSDRELDSDPEPDVDPDPAIFIIDLQDANEKLIKKKISAYYLHFEGAFTYIIFQRKQVKKK
jgi:hypothetical protein